MTNENVRLREWNMDDYDAVYDLWQRVGEGVQTGPSDTRTEIAKKLAHDPDLALVAEADGYIIGAVLGGFDGRRGWVYHLAVDAGWRGQGIGRQLMEGLERRLAGKGCRRVYLFVTPENVSAIHFYEALGWQQADLVPLRKDLL